MATWFGLQPAPVEHCRVLELGCGSGANIIPMAFGLPDSVFVGYDLAHTVIAEGQAVVEALRLRNIELHALDLRALSRDLGTFDYVIAHGLYAWVEPAVQEAILNACAQHLAPHGVAYISYNAYPGAHIREMVRDMLLFHIRHLQDDEQRLAQALDFVRFLSAGMLGSELEFLRQELDSLLDWRPAYVFHDHLAPFSEPLYFSQFVERARQHGLQYLAEANIFDMQDGNFPPAVREYLRRIEALRGLVEKEQYLDFLKNRRFRQTLLCRDDAPIRRAPPPDTVKQFWIASRATPVSATPDYRTSAVERFNGPGGASLQTDQPLVKSAIGFLGQIWPERVHFEALFEHARSLAGGADATGEHALVEALEQGFLAGLIELHVHSPRLARHAGPRPEASPLARLEARSGSMVTTLLHSNVELEDDAARQALQLMDGTRDRRALAAALDDWARGQDLTSGAATAPLSEALERNLELLARQGLLLA
jgi:SAM-dependent methyltransferase